MPDSFYFSSMKKAGLVSTLVTLCTLISVFSQTHQSSEYRQWVREAKRLYDLEEPTRATDSTALHLFDRAAVSALAAKDYQNAANCHIKAGNIHQTYQRFTESNQNYHKALTISNAYLSDKRLVYEASLYMGSSHYFSNIIDSAQYYFESASSIAVNYKGAKLPEEERLYNSLGAIYFESANYLQAKNYFEKALLVTPTGTTDYEASFVGINSNVANCLQRLNQYDAALRIYQKLLQYDMQKDVSEIIRQNTAHTYFKMGQYDSALAIYQQLNFENALNRTKALNDIGRIYMNRRQWQQSEAVFDSAIAVNKNISSVIRNKEEALAYLYRGQLAVRQGLTDEAITWCNEALQEVHLNFRWKTVTDIPDDVSQSVSPVTLFEILRTKAGLLFKKYKTGKQLYQLSASILTFRKAIETANYIKLNFDNDEAKLFFNENYQPIYSEAISAAYEQYKVNKKEVDDYIFILENYKGSVLHQNLQSILLKSTAQVPDSIKRRERDIRQLLAFYTSRINNNAAESDARRLQNRLLELQVELSRLQKLYEKDESYNLYKYQASQSGLNLKKIQEAIDNETALVNFYQADSALYLLAVSKKNVLIEKINTDTVFNSQLRFFLSEIYQHTEGKRYEGAVTSITLYQKLLQPAAAVINTCRKWIIIPDRTLYYLPIEALLTKEGDKEYVVESKSVSYHYSFALLFQKNTHHFSDDGKREAVAFAPYAGKDNKVSGVQLALLPYSKNEIIDIASNSFISEMATKKKFTEIASKYPFIHLATHASTGTDTSANWIQFYPSDSNELNNKLFLDEIYNLDLHRTELVILSACETAHGDMTSGEGLLSLSRAFLYAGSDGIISTLWKTEDEVTAYLMQRVHVYLKQNMAPEKALQLAKIDLLKDKTIGAQYKTPNYWSNFIYVGKVPMTERKNTSYWWFVAIVPAIILLLILFKQKKVPA